jgi:pentafunctional AROM polypeptide
LHREPLYAESSQYDFLCVSPQGDLEDDHAQFLLLADRAVRNARVPITKGTVTISLTHTDMALAAADAAAMERCADAFELRVDLLGSGRSLEDLRSQYTLLRRATSLPIIWTIRSKAQGGEQPRDSIIHSRPAQHNLNRFKS